MKIKLSLLSLVFVFMAKAQTYHFDYTVESKYANNKQNSSVEYHDSLNNTSMHFVQDEKKLLAILFDENKHLRHCFRVSSGKENFTFNYSHTNDFSAEKKSHVKKECINILKIDSLHFEITAFKNEKRKTKKFAAYITLEKSDFNFLSLSIDHVNSNDIADKLKKLLPENSKFIIKKIKVDYDTGYSFNQENTLRKVNFSLSVPENMIVRKYEPWKEFEL